MDGHALFVLQVGIGSRRLVLDRALALGLEHGTDASGEVLLLARTRDAEELGRLAERLAGIEGVRSVDCSVAVARPPRTPPGPVGTYL
jgi:hypothetical protein